MPLLSLHSKRASRLLCVLSIAAATLLLSWRRPDALTNPQLWAEDASRLFTNAHLSGFASLFMPFAGYYHTVARLVALVGNGLPLEFVPHLYHLAFWLALVFTIGYLFSARFDFPPLVKVMLAIAIVANPAGNEVFWNLANFPFFLPLLLLLLAISSPPRNRGQAVFDCLLLLLVGLSTPFALCLWPLFVVRWLAVRSSHNRTLALLSLLVVPIQVWHMAYRIDEGGALPPLDPRLLDVVIYRSGFLLLGELVYKVTMTSVLRVCGLMGVLAVFGYLVWRGMRSRNQPQLMLLLAALGIASLSLYVLRHTPDMAIFHAQRHTFLPAVALMWTLSLATASTPLLERALLAAMVISFLFLTPSSKGEVRLDLQWAEHVARCRGTQPLCTIPVNPVGDPPVWFAYVDPYRLPPPPVQHPYAATFAGEIALLGYDMEQTGSALDLTLVWQAEEAIARDYKFFVHLSPAGDPAAVLAQHDAMPRDWQYPTSLWRAGEVVAEEIELSLASLAPGRYRVSVGWYLLDAGDIQRLPANDAQGTSQPNGQITLPTPVVVRG